MGGQRCARFAVREDSFRATATQADRFRMMFFVSLHYHGIESAIKNYHWNKTHHGTLFSVSTSQK